MTTVTIQNDTLYVQLDGIEPVFAFRRAFEIPLEHVQGATTETPPLSQVYKGIRAPGTHIPGVITAGTYYKDNLRIFWNVHRGQEAVAIHLTLERYEWLILGVRNAQHLANHINAALERYRQKNPAQNDTQAPTRG